MEFKPSRKGSIQFYKHHPDLKLIGTGRSACAFRIRDTDKVIKIFPPQFEHVAQEEAEIYRVLENTDYFPTIYESGSNYIVMDFIEGHTLFECLNKGVPIDSEKIKEIDIVLELARQKGLNPSDIHLRNIFLTPASEIKLIDVARFKQKKQCSQWDDLKNAYYRYYLKPYFPRKIPSFLLNLIAALYKSHLIPIPRK
ncbi:protein kinase family protein [Bacillus sp. IB182487]|uniref:Protein kinase family protein n=1 Tax=Metabacillus arenae TaxID=2771434 RepID=A0A926NHT9_9BACI|nr:protein kinase family protein [Metabacillus arenae]